jgi:RHS repeat-associated protein
VSAYANEPIWQKDADGNISYTAYDPATGAVVEQIQDVDSSQASTLDMPSVVSLASGSHLGLKTTYQVDGLGRVVEETDPDMDATFIVYDDADHETRTYTGFVQNEDGTYSEESDLLPPIVVTIDNLIVNAGYFSSDQTGSYSETFSMSATPSLATDGAPNGSEDIADIQSLSLSVTNQAGQVIQTDAYYNLPSFSGAVSSGVVGSYNILNAFHEVEGVWGPLGALWTPGTESSEANYYMTQYAYDFGGDLDREQSPDGDITRWAYDGVGRLASVWVGGNGWSGTPDDSYSIDDAYFSPSTPGNMIELASYQYDDGNVGDSNVTQIIDFESEDGSTTITPRVTQFFYDWEDRLVATKQGVPLDDYYQGSGDEQAYVEDLTDETTGNLGAQLPITYYTLDNLGEVTAEQVYDGNDVAISSSDGVPVAPTSGLMSETDYVYDALGRVDETTQDTISCGSVSGGQSTYTEYDGDGNVVSSTDPLDNVTYYTYDGAGELVYAEDPNYNTTAYTYDADGNLKTVTDPLGNVTTYDYDYAGRQTAEYEPNQDLAEGYGGGGGGFTPETTYGYNAAGELASMTDPDDNTTYYTYDALGRETGTSEEVSETASTAVDATNSYTYDGDNNLVQEIDADGRVDAYSYNDLDQQTQELWYANTTTAGEGSGYATNTIATSYDLSGDTLSAVDTYPSAYASQDSSETFTYNTLGQEVSVDNNGGETGGTAGVPDVVLNSTYDANGNRLSLSATIAGTADFKNTYRYDALGNELSVTQQGVSGGDTVAYKRASMSYDPDGRLAGVSAYDGTSCGDLALMEEYGYDGDGNLVDFSASGYGAEYPYGSGGYSGYGGDALEILNMTYDGDGELTELDSTLSTTYSHSYTYDGDGQLLSDTGSGPEANYSYDANGGVDYGFTGYSSGSGNVLLAGSSYTYDAAGNMTSSPSLYYSSDGPDAGTNTNTYTWDNRNRLTSTTTKNSDGVTLQVVKYTYDAFNQLIGESVTPYTDGVAGTTTTQRFVYDPLTGEMQLAFNGSGNLTDRFLWGPLVDQVLADEQVTSLGSAGSVNWIVNDGHGGPTDVWSASTSTWLNHIEYDAFGDLYTETSSANVPLFGYDGEYTDPATGLQYHSQPFTGLPGRWYDPEAEVWMGKDPIFPFSGPNPYEYCGNNPTSFVDPSGHIIPLIAAGVVAAVYFFTPNTANAPGPGDATISGDPNAGLLPAALAGAGVASGGIVGGAVGGAAVADAAALGGSDAAASFLGAVVGGKVGSAVGSTVGGLSGSGPARAIGDFGGGLLGGIGGAKSVCPAAGGGIGATGQIGENALKSLGGESQVYFRTSMGGRYVDQLAGGIANESKVGYQSLTQDIQLQIAKDAELMQTGAVKGATWHFFTSPATGLGGPSQPLLNALQQAGIKVVTH